MNDNNDNFIPLQMPPAAETPDSSEEPSPPSESTAASQALPTMRSVKDLINTLARMNKRLVMVEEENEKLRKELETKVAKREVIKMVANVEALNPPKHGLTSDSFLVRALSIYGHWFVINLVISIIMSIISFILFASLLTDITNSVLNSGV